MNYLNVSRSKPRIAGLFSLGALTLGISLGASSQAWAGAGIFDEPNTCTAINCGAQLIKGTYLPSPYGQALPFTTQIYAHAGACIRLEVISQQTDLELVLVSPNGMAWRDDDGGAGTMPLVKVNATPVMGWYSVQVSHYSGLGTQANFELRYGHYNSGNPNCSTPTPSI